MLTAWDKLCNLLLTESEVHYSCAPFTPAISSDINNGRIYSDGPCGWTGSGPIRYDIPKNMQFTISSNNNEFLEEMHNIINSLLDIDLETSVISYNHNISIYTRKGSIIYDFLINADLLDKNSYNIPDNHIGNYIKG